MISFFDSSFSGANARYSAGSAALYLAQHLRLFGILGKRVVKRDLPYG